MQQGYPMHLTHPVALQNPPVISRPPQLPPAPMNNGPLSSMNNSPPGHIPQYDGADDDGESRDAKASSSGSSLESILQPAEGSKVDDELGSDLDDDDEGSNEDAEIDDLLLCLYDKVNRTRNKWKCNFKSGIAHIDGRDLSFTRLNADFEW